VSDQPAVRGRLPARLRRHRPRGSTLLLLAGLAVQLAPVLLSPWVLTQDGPAHVDGAWVLLHHGDDSPLGDLLREHYAVDLTPVPNMLTTLLLTVLLTVLGPAAAEKVVVAGFVLLLVAGLRYALRGVDRRAGWLAVAALPLAGGELVAYGFYNFCWGVALALFAIGWALRRRDGWDAAGGVVLSVLLLLTWSAHLMPWLVAAGVTAGLGLVRAVADRRDGLPAGRALVRHLGDPALALLPSAALSAHYVLGNDGGAGAAAGVPGLARVGSLLTLYRPLVVSSWWEIVPAAVVAVLLAGLLVVAVRRPARPGDPQTVGSRADRVALGVATGVATAAFLLSPSRLGDEYGFLPDRLAWFPPLLLVLFCGTRPPSRVALRRIAAGGLVLAASAAVLVRLPTQVQDQRDAAEVVSVAADLPPGSTFAVLRFSGHQAALAPLSGEPDPLRHLSSRLAVLTQGVDLGHYEAIFPYFQVRFTPTPGVRRLIDPDLRGLDQVPPTVDLPAAGQHLDYVLVVGLDRAEGWVRQAHRTARVLDDLRAGYQQAAESGPSGYVEVWRLRRSTGG
jgi:hypothetical protein